VLLRVPTFCAVSVHDPAQVKLMMAAADQLAADALATSSRLKREAGGAQATTAEVMSAAGAAAASAAAHMVLEAGQEGGGSSAAASKAATALVETAGLVAPPARLPDLPEAAAEQHAPSSRSPMLHHQTTPTPRRRQQQETAAADTSARAASRAAAGINTLQVLVSLPYAEVLCFADTQEGSSSSSADMAAASSGHRYPVRSVAQLLRNSQATMHEPQQQQQPQSLMLRWASRLAPVADLVLTGFSAGSSSSTAGGALAAKLQLSSVLLVNLQLLDLCRSPATLPSAAGVYLPSGYAVPRSSSKGSSTAAPGQQRSQAGSRSATAEATGPPRLSANYNAFVLSPLTARTTVAYQAGALHRLEVLGLSCLTADGSSSSVMTARLRPRHAVSGSSSFSGGLGSAGGVVVRGAVSRTQLVRHRWRQVLHLRAFVKCLDYAMFLMFQQEQQGVLHAASGGSVAGDSTSGSIGSAREQYLLLYRFHIGDLSEAVPAEHPAVDRRASWFSKAAHSTRSSSVGGGPGGGHGSFVNTPIARTGSLAGSITGSPSVGGATPGSPCNWRGLSMSRSVSDRLVTAERVLSRQQSSVMRGGGSFTASSLGVNGNSNSDLAPLAAAAAAAAQHQPQQQQQQQQPRPAAPGAAAWSPQRPVAHPIRLQQGRHSYTGGAEGSNGLPPVAEHSRADAGRATLTAAASAAAGAASAGDSIGQELGSLVSVASGSASSSPKGGVGGMQVMNALRSLRSGSSHLVTLATQQLRLRRHQEKQQQQRQRQNEQPPQQWQRQQQPHSPSRLGAWQQAEGSGATLSGAGQHAQQAPGLSQCQQHSQPLPQAWNTPVQPALDREGGQAAASTTWQTPGPPVGGAAWGQQQQPRPQDDDEQQQQHPAESILDFLGLLAAFGSISTAVGREDGVPAATLQQPQLSMLLITPPQLRQQQPRSAPTAAGLGLGRSSSLGQLQAALDDAGDSVSVSVAHVKLLLGPHSVSMLLQLATSLTAAACATPAAGSRAAPPAAPHQHQQQQRGARMSVRLQLAVCHLTVNMERTVLPGSVAGSSSSGGQLQTKGLLSLLLLNAGSTARYVPDAPAAGSPSAAATGAGAGASSSGGAYGGGASGPSSSSSDRPGTEVSCSVAHVGLQDLRTTVEQRHVLSGATEPYTVSTVGGWARPAASQTERMHALTALATLLPLQLRRLAATHLQRQTPRAAAGRRPARWRRRCCCRRPMRQRQASPLRSCWLCTSRASCWCGAS
jgi:hypothetical protein